MSNKKFYGFLLITAVVSVLGAMFLIPGGQTIIEKVIPDKLGSLTGPDIPFSYISINQVKEFYGRQDMNQATTTICALQAPTTGTTTLVFASLRFTTSTTTVSMVEIAKDTTAYATTTRIGSLIQLNANASATIVASTTLGSNGNSDEKLIFAPGEWLVVKMTGSYNPLRGSVWPVGICNAKWMSTF